MVALAQYDEPYWFPTGELARNIPATVFPDKSNTPAALYADQAGTQPLPNPVPTDNNGHLRFWAEAGMYWISIDTESFRVGVGTQEVGVSPQQLAEAIAEHAADHTDVHGVAEMLDLETKTGAQARVDAHAADTTDVHGIPDTGALETQTGAQAKADAAQSAAETAASQDATGKVNAARAELSEEITQSAQQSAAALAVHAADTTDVHGIPDTGALISLSDLAGYATHGEVSQVQTNLDAHAATTTDVHGIPDTADLLTSADLAGYATQQALDAHTNATTDVHGIPDTSALLTTADLSQYATEAELAAHATATTDVHGIPDTGALVKQADLEPYATDADLAAHASSTQNVHGIPDTSALLTDADLAGVAQKAELDAHVNATMDVHGIPDTSQLLTTADLSQYATEAELAAHAADTTSVHGIPDTSLLVEQADLAPYATDAELAAHASSTQNVHGIPDTADLVKQADLTGLAQQSALDAHVNATTGVHGISDTAALETQAGAQAKANGARDAAVADAVTKYLALAGGTVTGNTTFTGPVNLTGTAQITAQDPSAVGLASQVQGEAFDRYRLLASGAMEWGPGAAARDAFLSREAPGILTARETLFRVYRDQAASNAFASRVTGDTASRWFVNADGGMNWGPGGTSGADTGLARSGPATLSTNALLQTNKTNSTDGVRDIRLASDPQPRFYQVASGQMYWGPGTATLDTLLYRDKAASLVTDGDFTVNGRLFVGGLLESTGTTPASGFTVANQNMRNAAGFTWCHLGLTVSTALTTPGGTTGNVSPDKTICTVPANWRPKQAMIVAAGTGASAGTVRIGTDGTVQMVTWDANASIAASEVIRFMYVFA
ncbi:hypothetical protein ACFPC0_10985 [Streptomyces andamanensis]|uniref:Uncharacterized protein n=1 Tax=Streptomyces andamanensis TaxID=1565035 RepID=A0ABV8TCI3_9ACTN